MTTQGGQTIRRICTGFTGITAVLILLVYGRSILSSSNVVKFIPFKGQLLNKGALFPLSWQVDGLGAFFIFVLLLGQTLASFYAWGYLKEYQGRKSLNLFSFFWILFLISMYGVVIAGDGFTFLLMWELMSLFSFFLVLYEHEESHNRRAAFIYLVMTHVGTVFLTSAILFIYSKTGTFSFEAWSTIKSLVPAWQLNLLYLCFFIGLGTKAGMVPLHIWLPYAHSAAPTPVSALMSGVMVKIALYVFLRIIWVSIGISAAWWGWLLLVIGAASALIGILFASVEGDIKRTLAYSTVENVGILTMAMGLAFVAKYYEMNSIAILALAAFCWHLLQHLLFKSVMFMGAGNVIQATHTRRLELMGGLLKRLPKTGKWVLISAAGLAALPPLGGFWGEWLLFNSLWQGAREMSDGWSRVVLPLCVSLLGIVGAVAVATMVKWFGIIFLGQPRSNQMLYATEVEPSQHWAMFIGVMLALASILYPFGFLSIIHIPIQTLSGSDFSAGNLESSQVYGVIMTLSELAGASLKYIILVFLLGSAIHLLNRNVIRKTGPSWNCGGDLTPRMQYSAAGVTMPIRIVFRRILGSNPLVEKEFTVARYFLNSLKYRGELKAVFEDILYRPSKASLLWLAKKIRFIQTGNIHLYLGYVLITLVVVLFLGN